MDPEKQLHRRSSYSSYQALKKIHTAQNINYENKLPRFPKTFHDMHFIICGASTLGKYLWQIHPPPPTSSLHLIVMCLESGMYPDKILTLCIYPRRQMCLQVVAMKAVQDINDGIPQNISHIIRVFKKK